jgi:hypothetical protein
LRHKQLSDEKVKNPDATKLGYQSRSELERAFFRDAAKTGFRFLLAITLTLPNPVKPIPNDYKSLAPEHNTVCLIFVNRPEIGLIYFQSLRCLPHQRQVHFDHNQHFAPNSIELDNLIER